MIGTPPFPTTLGELTSRELSEALGVEVTNFEAQRVGADRGMLGEIFLLSPTYANAGAGPGGLIAKFAAPREEALASALRAGVHERELRCYDELLAVTDVSTPEFYGAWYDPDTAHFLLLQAAVDADQAVDQIAGLDVELVKLVLTQAAQLHHRWWQDPTLRSLGWLPSVDGPVRRQNLARLAENGWQPLCDLVGDEFDDADRAIGSELPARLDAGLAAAGQHAQTLIHSDLRADNLLFNADHTQVSLIDWQGASTGPAGFEVAYVLLQTLTVEDRRLHEQALLDHYRGELSRCGTELGAADLERSYRESIVYSLAVACSLPLLADPGEARVKQLAVSMARRTIEALRDHDLLWVSAG